MYLSFSTETRAAARRGVGCAAVGLILAVAGSLTGFGAEASREVARLEPSIIPRPVSSRAGEGAFAVDGQTVIRAATRPTADYLAREWQRQTGRVCPIVGPTASPTRGGEIVLELSGSAPAGEEAYRLTIAEHRVRIGAQTETGLFYGVQSLLQMIEAQGAAVGGAVALPAVTIEDRPRFAWRGLLLDESRHFFGKAVVKSLLDTMAALKLNRFHWHLTDEPGWRIEIKAYPKLTAIGGVGNWSDPQAPAQFYTQAEIREIVAYAAERHILIVPEIDMPGHATAATRAYPELSGGGMGQWAGFTFNPGSEGTYRFLETALGEVAALFPGPYLHLGCDEVQFGSKAWLTDPADRKFAQEHGLAGPGALEGYFVRRMVGIVQHLGKTPIGWDEIGGDGVPPQNVVAMWWRHDKPQVLTDLLRQGYSVVLSPRLPCYFDFVQDASHRYGRRINGAFNDLARTYAFPDPVTAKLIPPGSEAHVLGLEACVWTERIQTPARLEFMIFPRLAAIAEDGWSEPARKAEASFRVRLRPFLRTLDREGLAYFDPFDPARTPEPAGPEKKPTATADQ